MTNQEDKDQNEVVVEENSDSSTNENGTGSSTNLEENVAGFLCYLATAVTGIIFLIIEKKSKFIRFHAMQSTIFFIAIWVVNYIIKYVPFIGGLLGMLVSLFSFIMWIVLMIKAYQKEYFKLPIIGQIADDFVNKKA